MDGLTLLLFFCGFALLVAGAELLVRSSARLAELAGISKLVVGLTVVAYGTSAPELAVTVKATYSQQSELAVGNVVGSNTSNILLVLGMAALAAPLMVARGLFRVSLPVMMLSALLVLVLASRGEIGRWEGAVMALGAVAYTVHAVRSSRLEIQLQRKAEGIAQKADQPRMGFAAFLVQPLLILAGLGLLLLGAEWLVDGAVALAKLLGVSELVIGLTIVAVGTSLPEIATSIVAALRGHRDIAVGNVVGSNIFNVLFVLGLTCLVAPGPVKVPEAALWFDIPIMVAASAACFPVFFTGHVIDRWEGGFFLAYYAAYVACLGVLGIQGTGGWSILPWFVVPLVAATVLALAIRWPRR